MQAPANLQECIREMAKREQTRLAQEVADAQLKIVTATFDRSAAYTNLMLVGGYAGFFGLWQLTKEFLTKHQALWSALLVLVSLVLFIVFEVVQMIVIAKSIQQKAALLRSPEARASPAILVQRLDEVESAQQRGSAKFMLFWRLAVGLSLGTALAGAGVLGRAFVIGLLR